MDSGAPGLPCRRAATRCSVGPLGLNVTTVAFDVIPRLSVNQEVEVVPYVKSAAFDFDKPVDVMVNGGSLLENVQTVSFVPGDTIEIDSGGESSPGHTPAASWQPVHQRHWFGRRPPGVF